MLRAISIYFRISALRIKKETWENLTYPNELLINYINLHECSWSFVLLMTATRGLLIAWFNAIYCKSNWTWINVLMMNSADWFWQGFIIIHIPFYYYFAIITILFLLSFTLLQSFLPIILIINNNLSSNILILAQGDIKRHWNKAEICHESACGLI